MNKQTSSSVPSSLRPYLEEIAARLLSGHAAVMIGSGFSKNATPFSSAPPFPDWPELGNRFYQRLHGHEPLPRTNYLQVPVLAHEIKAAFGRPALDQMLRDEIPDLMHEPSQLHVDLLSLPWSDVMTTNYDTLLERACRSVVSRRYDIVVNPDDLERSRRPRIIKLHGSLPTDRPFIVTDEDYRRYPLNFAPFVNTVRQALLEKTLCLVGFSGDDPNFLQWIGWIRDNLPPRASRKMYMIGLFSFSHSQRMLLEQRHIIPIDMSECPGVDQDHYEGLNRFVAYLRSRGNEEDPLAWPSDETSSDATDDEESLLAVVTAWRSTRAKYPGWVVVPEDRRRDLWNNTRTWIERDFPGKGALRGPLDVEFAFELTWRTAKCLVPIFDNHAHFVEAIVNRYWPVTQSSGALPALVDEAMMLSRGLTVPMVARMCHYLLLSMMRYYREEGLSEKWLAASEKIETIEHTLSSEAEARFHYERTLFSMFSLNLDEVKQRLQEWPENDAHPFWSARKAALMAEIGLLDEAERVLALSLEAIRTKSNLTPTHSDYTLASQESFVMFLLHAARHRSFFDKEDPSDARDQRREFSGRWHALRQYKCDPWHELEVFRNKLERPPKAMRITEEVPTFDIGRVTRTHRLGAYDTERMTAYNFLRFCEDSGVPFRLGEVVIGTSTATGTLPRIASQSSHWALATLVRIGEPKAVDEVYDRSSLARLDAATVDRLIGVYLRAVRRARSDIESGTGFGDQGFGDRLAWVVPEILSRLCCKCSFRAKEELVGFLLEVYKSEQRVKYRGIRNLTQRLLEALTVHEQAAMIPELLRFPILDDLGHLERREFVNPFNFVRIPENKSKDKAMVSHETLEMLLDVAASESASGRRWAVTTLGQMHDMGMLTDSQVVSYGRVLWSQTGVDGLPADTDYGRYAFLDFPHPADVDPETAFVEYVRRAEFPAQQDGTKTSVGGGGRRVVLCGEIEASAGIPWAPDDVRSIAYRLIAWLDADRSHLRRAASREKWRGVGGPSVLQPLKRQVRQLVRTLAVVVTRWPEPVDNGEIRDALRRVVGEMSEDGVPTLSLRLACGRLIPGWWERALEEIENQDASTSEEDVVDAFVAILVVSERGRRDGELEDDDDIVKRFMAVVANAIRWLSAEPLVHAIQAMRRLVERHPSAFVDECERAVLERLDGLVRDTTVGRGRNEHQGEGATSWDASETRKEVAIRLLIRREGAALAYRLFRLYRRRNTRIPEGIKEWERICRSEEEFAEIRREWMSEPVTVVGE